MSGSRSYEERLQEHFETYLKLKGYRVHRMPGDANSLYHSIAAGVNDEFNRYRMRTCKDMMTKQADVRKKLQRHVVINLDRLSNYFKTDEVATPEERQHLINLQANRIGQNFQGGGDPSIAAAAEVFKRKFVVERPLESPLIFNEQQDGDPVFLSVHKNHYNLLEPGAHPRPTVPRAAQLHFNDYLKLKQYKVETMTAGIGSPYSAIALGVKGSVDLVDAVRLDIKFHLLRNLDDFKERIFERIQSGLAVDASEEDKELAIDEFVQNLYDNPSQGNEFIVEVASHCYNKPIVVERHLDSPLVFNREGTDSKLYLALQHDGRYDYLVMQECSDDEELDDDVVWIDPEGRKIEEEDSAELMFIKANIYRNMRTPVTVAFMVPIPYLTHKKLEDAIKIEKPDYIQHIVFYNQNDFTKLKQDKEARHLFTLYTHTFHGPMDKSMMNRIVWMAHLLLPPIFWTMKRCTWQGVSVESVCKFGFMSLPMILFTHAWNTVKDAVRIDTHLLTEDEDKLMCNGCHAECELKEVKSHYDTKKFDLTSFEEIRTVKSLDRYDIFDTEDDEVPKVVQKIQELYNSPERHVVPALLRYLETPASVVQSQRWSTYMVLHVDGPFIHHYNGNDSYFRMLNDERNVKSIYVGTTTDSVFRLSHFIQTSSLSQIFSRTSKLFLLRSIKFDTQEEARRDEAILLEIVTTLLESRSQKKIPVNFLFLNACCEAMYLLPEATTSHPKIWAEFASKEIPVFQMNEEDDEQFVHGPFTGNYSADQELEVLDGFYSTRTFEELEDVYTRISARQP